MPVYREDGTSYGNCVRYRFQVSDKGGNIKEGEETIDVIDIFI